MSSRHRERDGTLIRMGAANPASAEALRRELDAADTEAAMRRAIAIGGGPGEPAPAGDRVDREFAAPRRSPLAIPRRAAFAAAAAPACLAAAVLVLTGLPGRGGGAPEYARAAIEVAEANPRLLVTAPGWQVTRADELEVDSGEVSFGDGSHRLTVAWYPARYYRRYLSDRAHVSAQDRSTLLDRAATTVEYSPGEYATMLAPWGTVFVEIRGDLGSRDAYDEILRSLQPVDIDAWLAAMPASAVTPAARPEAVEEILREVPLPPNFDLEALKQDGAVRDRYQLTAEATGAVACGWVESWLAAKRAGDAARMATAVDAMATWSQWPALATPQMRRGWAANIRQAAHRIADDNLNFGPAGTVVNPDGSGYELGPAWSVALGCKPRWHRPLAR